MIAAIKSLLKQAAQARGSGETEEAERLYKQAAADAKAKDDATRAEALLGVAQARRDQRDLISASINYAEAITLLRAGNDNALLAFALRHAADVRSELREYAAAASHIEEAIRLYRALLLSQEAAPLDLANALRVQALNDERQAYASWTEAEELYATAAEMSGRKGDDAGVAECQAHRSLLKHQG